VPSWWSKPLKELKLATFNARAETVTEKPFIEGFFQQFGRARKTLRAAVTQQSQKSQSEVRRAEFIRPKRAASASGFSVRTGYTAGSRIDQVNATAKRARHHLVNAVVRHRRIIDGKSLHCALYSGSDIGK
jgi:hypothetical protein